MIQLQEPPECDELPGQRAMHNNERAIRAAIIVQSFYRGYSVRKQNTGNLKTGKNGVSSMSNGTSSKEEEEEVTTTNVSDNESITGNDADFLHEYEVQRNAPCNGDEDDDELATGVSKKDSIKALSQVIIESRKMLTDDEVLETLRQLDQVTVADDSPEFQDRKKVLTRCSTVSAPPYAGESPPALVRSQSTKDDVPSESNEDPPPTDDFSRSPSMGESEKTEGDARTSGNDGAVSNDSSEYVHRAESSENTPDNKEAYELKYISLTDSERDRDVSLESTNSIETSSGVDNDLAKLASSIKEDVYKLKDALGVESDLTVTNQPAESETTLDRDLGVNANVKEEALLEIADSMREDVHKLQRTFKDDNDGSLLENDVPDVNAVKDENPNAADRRTDYAANKVEPIIEENEEADSVLSEEVVVEKMDNHVQDVCSKESDQNASPSLKTEEEMSHGSEKNVVCSAEATASSLEDNARNDDTKTKDERTELTYVKGDNETGDVGGIDFTNEEKNITTSLELKIDGEEEKFPKNTHKIREREAVGDENGSSEGETEMITVEQDIEGIDNRNNITNSPIDQGAKQVKRDFEDKLDIKSEEGTEAKLFRSDVKVGSEDNETESKCLSNDGTNEEFKIRIDLVQQDDDAGKTTNTEIDAMEDSKSKDFDDEHNEREKETIEVKHSSLPAKDEQSNEHNNTEENTEDDRENVPSASGNFNNLESIPKEVSSIHENGDSHNETKKEDVKVPSGNEMETIRATNKYTENLGTDLSLSRETASGPISKDSNTSMDSINTVIFKQLAQDMDTKITDQFKYPDFDNASSSNAIESVDENIVSVSLDKINDSKTPQSDVEHTSLEEREKQGEEGPKDTSVQIGNTKMDEGKNVTEEEDSGKNLVDPNVTTADQETSMQSAPEEGAELKAKPNATSAKSSDTRGVDSNLKNVKLKENDDMKDEEFVHADQDQFGEQKHETEDTTSSTSVKIISDPQMDDEHKPTAVDGSIVTGAAPELSKEHAATSNIQEAEGDLREGCVENVYNHFKSDEERKLNDDDISATTIQKAYRGYRVRKDLKRQMNVQNTDEEDADQVQGTPVPDGGDASSVAMKRENDAAVNIQKHYKGYRVRRDLKEQSQDDENQKNQRQPSINTEISNYLKAIVEPITKAFSVELNTEQSHVDAENEGKETVSVYIPLRDYSSEDGEAANATTTDNDVNSTRDDHFQEIEATTQQQHLVHKNDGVFQDNVEANIDDKGIQPPTEEITRSSCEENLKVQEKHTGNDDEVTNVGSVDLRDTKCPTNDHETLSSSTKPQSGSEPNTNLTHKVSTIQNTIRVDLPQEKDSLKNTSVQDDTAESSKAVEEQISRYINSMVEPVKRAFSPNTTQEGQIFTSNTSHDEKRESPIYIPLRDYSSEENVHDPEGNNVEEEDRDADVQCENGKQDNIIEKVTETEEKSKDFNEKRETLHEIAENVEEKCDGEDAGQTGQEKQTIPNETERSDEEIPRRTSDTVSELNRNQVNDRCENETSDVNNPQLFTRSEDIGESAHKSIEQYINSIVEPIKKNFSPYKTREFDILDADVKPVDVPVDSVYIPLKDYSNDSKDVEGRPVKTEDDIPNDVERNIDEISHDNNKDELQTEAKIGDGNIFVKDDTALSTPEITGKDKVMHGEREKVKENGDNETQENDQVEDAACTSSRDGDDVSKAREGNQEKKSDASNVGVNGDNKYGRGRSDEDDKETKFDEEEGHDRNTSRDVNENEASGGKLKSKCVKEPSTPTHRGSSAENIPRNGEVNFIDDTLEDNLVDGKSGDGEKPNNLTGRDEKNSDEGKTDNDGNFTDGKSIESYGRDSLENQASDVLKDDGNVDEMNIGSREQSKMDGTETRGEILEIGSDLSKDKKEEENHEDDPEPFYLHRDEPHDKPFKISEVLSTKVSTSIDIDAKENDTKRLLHSSEFHDVVPLRSPHKLDEVTRSIQTEEKATATSTVIVHSGELRDNLLPLAVQLNDVPGQVFVIIVSAFHV